MLNVIFVPSHLLLLNLKNLGASSYLKFFLFCVSF